MPDGSDYATLFAEICHEWDEAERDLKNAELVCGEVIIPSIKELRYAGRRLAQALQLWGIAENEEKIRHLLQDACFDCHRARHDAIDAATAQISKVLVLATDKLGYDVVLKVYPDFPKLFQKLEAVRSKIVTSRGAAENRDKIYETIEHADFPNLIETFRGFQSHEPLMTRMAKKQRQTAVIIIGLGILGVVVGLVAILVEVYLHFLR